MVKIFSFLANFFRRNYRAQLENPDAIKRFKNGIGGPGERAKTSLKSFPSFPRFSSPRHSRFTLIEVLVALAILSMGLLASLSLTATSQQRLSKAVRHWENQHMLAQALEYYLLTNGSNQPPPEVFPYPEYQVRCELDDAAGLPEGIDPRSSNWRLRTMTVTITDGEGKVVVKTAVDRMIKDTD